MPKFTPSEEHIINESPEISVGEALSWTKRLSGVFPALQNRNYRLYFAGQLVSLIGTWLQIIAESWLVLKLTNSPFLIGLVAASAMAPTLLFSLFGGVIGDRFEKKKILIFTQSASMALALIYGVITIMGIITIPQIIILAFLLGVVNAIDSPARQAFVVDMVEREQMTSAISLNSGVFNGARVIGPSIAGFLIALVGTGGAFIINGLSYVAVIAALLAMKIQSTPQETHSNPIRAIKEGVSYASKHPVIKTLLIFTAVTSIFGWSYTTVLPIIAKNIFNLGADGLGIMYAASGLGALTAVVAVSAFSKKINAAYFILGGNAIFALALILFTFTTFLPLALFCLFLSGTGLLAQFTMMNTTIQHMVADKYRGRVMGLYTLMFLGLAPIGNLQIGYLSELYGTEFAIRIGAVITFLFGLVVLFYGKRITRKYEEYKKTLE